MQNSDEHLWNEWRELAHMHPDQRTDLQQRRLDFLCEILTLDEDGDNLAPARGIVNAAAVTLWLALIILLGAYFFS